VGDRLVARDRTVGAAEGGGVPTAGGGQRPEAQGLQDLRRTDVPRVRQQERISGTVQGGEGGGVGYEAIMTDAAIPRVGSAVANVAYRGA